MISLKRITILEVVACLGIGGIERAMQEFCLSIDKKRFRVIAAVYDPSGPRRKILENAGIEVVTITNDSLSKVIKKYKVDLVHAHTIHVTHLIPKNIPVLQEVVFSGGYDKNAALNLIISKTLATKVLTIFPSLQYDKDYRVLYYPQNVRAWDALRITQKHRTTLRDRLGFTDKHIVFGRVGRAEPSKTDYLLIASAPCIAKRVPNARFLFVGLPWLYRVWLQSKLSLRGKMVFLPETPDDADLSLFYQSIDIFWHTASRGETFGNVIAEAMTFGKPVMTHSTPFAGGNIAEHVDNAQIELVDHNVTGFVVNDPAAIVVAAQRFANNRVLCERMGRAGRTKVEQQYDARLVIRDFEKIVTTIVVNGTLPAMPSALEMKNFFEQEYPGRCMKQFSSTQGPTSFRYFFVKHVIYAPIEWCYLVSRKLTRAIGFNIEKKGYTSTLHSLQLK